MKTTNGLLGLGAIFALTMVFGLSGNALAASHGGHGSHGSHGSHGWHGSSRGGFGLVLAPRPAGYYQTVTETVMVAPETVEQFWVPPVYNTVRDAYGHPQVVKVRDGYMASRIIPARYQTVTRQVWVPTGGSRVSLGFGFRF